MHERHHSGEEACYILTLESQAAIELIALRADVEVEPRRVMSYGGCVTDDGMQTDPSRGKFI